MGVKITNNASGTLSAAITSSATTLTLASGQGALFPTLTGADYCWLTLVDTSNNVEVIKCTARSTDTMTIVRGQDNTTAQAFAINDRLELRPTAALFAEFADPAMGGDLTGTASNAQIAANAVGLAEMTGGTDGELITYDTSGDPTTVPVGTATHVLTSNGAGTTPTFQAVAAGVPTGAILMWHGAAGAIPSGWVICDGTNSTPNLTDKFIKSAATAGGTGGSATTGATTLTTAQMPAHTHGKSPYAPGSAAAYVASGYNSYFDAASNTTLSTGGGGSHTHPQSEPVYFALIFIMKT